jgi:hypothetical protein
MPTHFKIAACFLTFLLLSFVGLSQVSCQRLGYGDAPEDSLNRAMWFWHTEEMFNATNGVDEVLNFVSEQEVDHLFVQILTENDGSGGTQLRDAPAMRAFICSAAERGIKIHALDGGSDFALASKHDIVLDRVKAVLDFNDVSEASERFYAVRMDVEPYLLEEWRAGGASQQQVIQSFLEMNRKIIDLMSERSENLDYGVDIPFWFDDKNRDGEYKFVVDFEGLRTDLATHLIRMVDNIGIMAYRNRATGPNSTFELSLDELKTADREQAATVFIGFETIRPDGSGIPKIITFGHLSSEALNAAIDEVVAAAYAYDSFQGIALHHYKSLKKLVEATDVDAAESL